MTIEHLPNSTDRLSGDVANGVGKANVISRNLAENGDYLEMDIEKIDTAEHLPLSRVLRLCLRLFAQDDTVHGDSIPMSTGSTPSSKLGFRIADFGQNVGE